ncbi:MAG: CocE/NonD family hydrolase [Chloroflexi bacterium]|nr:CocE/NonD family hydrolase [Chloroflexota bacterium]
MEAETLFKIKVVNNILIPMRDDVRLAATLYLPEGTGPVPGVFSFVPYLKDGFTGIDHEPHHRYFANRGYAVMQVDFRGTGASEGRNPHPFDLQERQDGHDIVEWIAAQPWCTGAVGVWGISYGGITSLSIASTQPPHLKAIIPIHATYDNYEWLLRTHGCRGLLLADTDWGTRMAAYNLLPPVIADQDGRWISIWRDRLTGSSPWFMDWHGKAPDPTFWNRRKIPLFDIKVPTFAICGWYDAYTAPAFRVFEQVDAPTRVLIGPWKHVLPDLAPQSPIGGLHEMTRWWDRWLKDIPNGVENEPPVSIFVQGSDEWRYETEWPITRTRIDRLHLSGNGRLTALPPARAEDVAYQYDSRVGLGSTGHNGHRLHLAVPTDQSSDDHASLTFTSEPLEQDLEFTGEPKATLLVSADTCEMTLVVKLCLVDEAGRSRVISRGNANPARADAHAEVQPLRPSERRKVLVSLHPTSVVAKAGERLRVSLAGADFPELWPTPIPYQMFISTGPEGACFVDLPVVPARADEIARPDFAPARNDVGPPQLNAASAREQYDIVHQRLDARVASFETRLATRHRLADGAILDGSHRATVITDADRPGTTNLRTDTRYAILRPAGTVEVRVQSLISPFHVECRAEIDLDGHEFWRMSWQKDVDDWTESHVGRSCKPTETP